MCYIVIKGDRTMSLMSPAIYSSLFWELSRMEEFRNKRSIKDRCALLSQESPLPPDYNVRMYYVIRHTWWSEVKWLSHVRLFATPWAASCQDALSMGFSRQEYWSGLPFPSPGESSQPRDRTQVSHFAGGCYPLSHQAYLGVSVNVYLLVFG